MVFGEKLRAESTRFFNTPEVKKRFDWGYKTDPQAGIIDRTIPYTRGKVMGGSSSINGMVFIRGHRTNYDGWAADGCPGWSYDDVLPHFKRLEDWEGDAGTLRGKGGPIGLMQITPAAARSVGVANIQQLDNNVQAAARYLARLRRSYFANPQIEGHILIKI